MAQTQAPKTNQVDISHRHLPVAFPTRFKTCRFVRGHVPSVVSGLDAAPLMYAHIHAPMGWSRSMAIN